ncbi:hypothetical protein SAMN04488074_12910 [Lentzea albidocapillata subsp. violacea]|uniref:Uncharacterized protein n=1 Tax=Lentzea albidocapillata subsp. violacea TaxID=128104 RepID=A0A1G9X1K9_9PSEU|nr:hypothetical protein [Lentzea albidocapillata]SDM90588.1 hypothetical protein SAMN04488074_12910 [Lentzea albidocapillata subsp. violacea]
MVQPYLAEYRYYALFEDGHGMSDVGNAQGLYRSLGVYDEQKYDGHGVWRDSDGLSRAGDRDSYDDYREVSVAESERLRQLADDRGPARAERRDGFQGGGFAVFRREADLADLRSAYAVVDELLPEHRFSLPLLPSERAKLAAIIVLLAARRQAEVVDGHHYFAVFDRLNDFVALDRAHSLIRCPANGDGQWETFLHENQWVRGEEPRREHVLPVSREEARRISRLRETAGIRYFDVQLDSRRQREIVRRTGTSDEAVADLGWRPTDVLGRLQPHWVVEELGERGFGSARYVCVLSARSERFRGRPHDYQAIFGGDDVYDFGKVHYLARKLPTYELEYELWTPDGWEWTAGGPGGRSLPISEEEFQRLAAPRPDERGPGDVRR